MKKDSVIAEKVEEAPGFLLWQIEMCWQRAVNQILSNFDLTYTQFIVLYISASLSSDKKHVYQHQVARFSRIDRMMTSRILASLEKKQFIERDKLSGDARAKLVILTAKGREVLDKSLAAVSNAEEIFFKPAGSPFVKCMQDILADCATV